jgi:hypothetical protein
MVTSGNGSLSSAADVGARFLRQLKQLDVIWVIFTVRDESWAPLSAPTSPPSTLYILGRDSHRRPRTPSSLTFERDRTELPLTAWNPDLAPWPYPRHLRLLQSRWRYVLGERLQLPLLRWASCPLSVPCQFKVFSPKTSPRPRMRSSSAHALRKAMPANAMIAFSMSLSGLLQTSLLYCSHDSLHAARAAYCSRSPLPGATAPSSASVVRPPFAPLPWVALLVVL